MPGSKTYTTNKVNELLEYDFFNGINDLEKHTIKGVSRTVFGEIIKICLSLLLTTGISILTLPNQDNDANLYFNLSVITSCTVAFIVFYAFINGMLVIGKWLFDALFNKRLVSAEKQKGYLLFHKKIVNHIYLGISFENKYNVYIAQATGGVNDLNFDLASNYLSQSVYYFKIALGDINDLIPPNTKKKGFREKKNAEFLDYIGFPLLNLSLISAQRSLNRLWTTEQHIRTIIDSISANSNTETIKQSYSKSIYTLFEEIKSFIDIFEAHSERTLGLQEYLNCVRESGTRN